jgi:hypothetical protein
MSPAVPHTPLADNTDALASETRQGHIIKDS